MYNIELECLENVLPIVYYCKIPLKYLGLRIILHIYTWINVYKILKKKTRLNNLKKTKMTETMYLV